MFEFIKEEPFYKLFKRKKVLSDYWLDMKKRKRVPRITNLDFIWKSFTNTVEVADSSTMIIMSNSEKEWPVIPIEAKEVKPNVYDVSKYRYFRLAVK